MHYVFIIEEDIYNESNIDFKGKKRSKIHYGI